MRNLWLMYALAAFLVGATAAVAFILGWVVVSVYIGMSVGMQAGKHLGVLAAFSLWCVFWASIDPFCEKLFRILSPKNE